MAVKTLKDFDYDYQAYADYLESAQCANDEGYSTYVDYKGNIYDSNDWTQGHGHRNVYNGYERDKDDPRSQGRSWKNPWLKYEESLNITSDEMQLLEELFNQNDEIENNKTLIKRR